MAELELAGAVQGKAKSTRISDPTISSRYAPLHPNQRGATWKPEHIVNDGLRPRLTFLTDVVPAAQSTNGFGGRVFSLLRSLALTADVTLLLVDGNAEPKEIDVSAPDATWSLVTRPGAARPASALTKAARMVRLRTPSMCESPVRPLITAIRDSRPDVVVVHLPYLAHVVPALPAHLPVVSLMEEGWERLAPEPISAVRQLLRRWDLTRARRLYGDVARRSLVTAISDQECSWFARYGVSARVLPHAIDATYFRPEAGTPDLDVSVFGDLRADRNWRPAVEIFHAARARGHDWTWGFVGRCGPEIQALQGPRHLVTGLLADVRPFYYRAAVVLVPAYPGTGVKTTALQAWACGRPLVLSRHGTTGLAVEDGVNALIAFSANHAVELVSQLQEDPAWAATLAAAGRATVLEKHATSRVGALLTTYVTEQLARSRNVAAGRLSP